MKSVFLCLYFCLCIISFSYATEKNNASELASSQYKEQIKSILAQEKFGKQTTEKAWRIKPKNEDEEAETDPNDPNWLMQLRKWFDSISDGVLTFSKTIEFLFWGISIVFFLYLIYKYKTELLTILNNIKTRKQEELIIPDSVFGIDIKRNPLPENIIDTAKKHWESGDSRKSLSILLQASLLRLIKEYHCRFASSDTEQEVYQKIEAQTSPNIIRYMRQLISAWLQLAYAHRSLSDESFTSLCQQWNEVFK